MSDHDSPPDDSAAPASAPVSKGSPNDFLKAVVGKRVVVRLVSGVDYKGEQFGCKSPSKLTPACFWFLLLMHRSSGVLQCLDGYMNIAMEQTEEHVNGVVTNRYGDAFIRGNNGAFLG